MVLLSSRQALKLRASTSEGHTSSPDAGGGNVVVLVFCCRLPCIGVPLPDCDYVKGLGPDHKRNLHFIRCQDYRSRRISVPNVAERSTERTVSPAAVVFDRLERTVSHVAERSTERTVSHGARRLKERTVSPVAGSSTERTVPSWRVGLTEMTVSHVGDRSNGGDCASRCGNVQVFDAVRCASNVRIGNEENTVQVGCVANVMR